VDLLTVAFVTDGRRMEHCEYRPDFVLNLSMTIHTLDFVVGDMVLMHELRGIFGVQYFGLMMALETLSLRDMAISLNDMNVAPLAGDPPGDIPPVIEIPALDIDVAFGLNVAGGAPSHRARDAFLFPFGPCPIEMTDEAVRLMDS
jgi:hypothetical protein